MNDQGAEDQRQALEEIYRRSPPRRAEQGKLDPVIGRDEERFAVPFRYCSVSTKNNPVLIGEPGVGKNGNRRRPGAAYRQRRSTRRAERTSGIGAGYGGAGGRGRNTAVSLKSV
ncbi:hypothetical protein LNQ52_16745 [Klebsiella pneumoniae subsp. pneumoniae]|nr:hypothetical protein [Klebsiella pneumoniae subsp. pneumoniae]